MQIVRFRAGGKIRYGALEAPAVVEYSGTPFTTFRRGRRRYPLKQVVLLTPVVPSKIVALGLNYRDHAAELGVPPPDEPVLSLKPPSALIGPDDPIVHPRESRRIEFEGELAIVMKRRCRSVDVARAREYVLGYVCLNDVTARDIQQKDGRGSRAKAFDTFCPLGPCIATDIDPHTATIETYVNGERRQSSSAKEMIFPVEDIVARVSQIMTLLPGDVIATGTPPGVGALVPGDRVEVRIEGIGSLKNSVVKLG
jgi:2-keto-4-pentenoate hydratase/2-oxohepta-3-ene-1,7-dioic acid hydratase in catechol pathway